MFCLSRSRRILLCSACLSLESQTACPPLDRLCILVRSSCDPFPAAVFAVLCPLMVLQSFFEGLEVVVVVVVVVATAVSVAVLVLLTLIMFQNHHHHYYYYYFQSCLLFSHLYLLHPHLHPGLSCSQICCHLHPHLHPSLLTSQTPPSQTPPSQTPPFQIPPSNLLSCCLHCQSCLPPPHNICHDIRYTLL